MSSFINQYTDLLIKQYWDKPNASAEIALQAGTWNKTFTWLKSFEEAFDIDYALGNRLDIIGRIVGVDRNVPSIIPKIFFGFNGEINMTGFQVYETPQSNLGPFFLSGQSQYTTLELDDANFRFFIKAKIKKNMAHGIMTSSTYQSIQDAIITLFKGNAYIEDNMDMTMTLHVGSEVLPQTLTVMLTLDLFPKPQGVSLLLVLSDPTNTFGFSNNLNSKGFANKFNLIAEPGGWFLWKLI